MITVAILKAGAPLCREPLAWAPLLQHAADRYQINNADRQAMWLAQLAHESGQFNRLSEGMNYSAEGLMRTWPKRFPTVAIANKYARNPEKIANKVYANRLGNGSPTSGDGWNYRGAGLIQLTGKANFAKAAAVTGIPLVAHPDLARGKAVAAQLAAWFWAAHGLNLLADAGDFDGVTKKVIYGIEDVEDAEDFADVTAAINGGLIGLEDRAEYLERFRAALGV